MGFDVGAMSFLGLDARALAAPASFFGSDAGALATTSAWTSRSCNFRVFTVSTSSGSGGFRQPPSSRTSTMSLDAGVKEPVSAWEKEARSAERLYAAAPAKHMKGKGN